MTYGELNEKAQNLAYYLTSMGVENGDLYSVDY
jgi:hypothetical protein